MPKTKRCHSTTSQEVWSTARKWTFEQKFAQLFAISTGRPFGTGFLMHLHSEEPHRALELEVNPSDYQTTEAFAEDYQIAELLTKSSNVPGVDASSRAAAALTKFLSCEEANADTNARLWTEVQPAWFGEFSSNVLRILGPLGENELNEISELQAFGPGVNVGVSGEGLVPSKKFDAIPVCTPGLAPVFSGMLDSDLQEFWGEREPSLVPGNKHFTVPKKWSIDRCAAKEPLWNSRLQTAIGRKMVRRLKRFGINLHDQSVNQWLASQAFKLGLATIDLSSASDLLCRVLVVLALTYNGTDVGRRWLHLLSLARSPEMEMGDGVLKRLEMFSSMGNGFTFPLETIIFLAIIQTVVPATGPEFYSVYGDDMIVPQALAPHVIERLEYCGFQVNRKKTCLAGTFFESCGTDWFLGQNVRPFYLRQEPDSRIPYALQAANSLRAWCIRVYGCLPAKYLHLWKWCKSLVPQAWRHPVPSTLGDVGLHMSLPEARALGVRSAYRTEEWEGWEGWVVQYVAMRPVSADRRSFGVLACALRRAGTVTACDQPASRGLEPLRGIYGLPRVTQGVVPLEWDDFMWL
jgi:hypothetical protein